ncbi:MAG: hypothetical protein JO038_02820 [Alphaproteobacteria bacterium]|nr:hypothetical protein [Alphaproteobacteria bacterium]
MTRAILVILVILSVPLAVFMFSGGDRVRIAPEPKKEAATVAMRELGAAVGAASACRINSTADNELATAYLARPALPDRQRELSDAFNAGVASGIAIQRRPDFPAICNGGVASLYETVAASRSLIREAVNQKGGR